MEIVPGLMAPGAEAPLGQTPPLTVRRGIPSGDTEPAAWCMNLREAPGGGLQAVRKGMVTGVTDHPVVMADRRDNLRSFFTLDEDMCLRVALREREGDMMAPGGYTVAVLPSPIDSYAPVGEFLVLRLADGSLFYLLWNADLETYSALGPLPGFGGIGVEAVAQREVTATVAPAGFSSVVSDPRAVDLPTVARATVAAVRAAFRDASSQAAADGCWTQPVAVRMAWRLWDGSLLHVTPPVIPSGVEPSAGGRVQLPLTASDKGYAGTGEGSLSLPSYRLTAVISEALPEAWRDVVRTLEIWVTDEPDILTGDAGVGLVQSPSGFTVGVTLVRRSAAEVERMLEWATLGKMKTLDTAAGGLTVDILRQPFAGTPLDVSVVPAVAPSSAVCIASHGDRLYVASGTGAIVSTMRGNPFVTADTSLAPGGSVRAIAAQPSGGGAYTRQYVYLFTDRGISALTHDNDGRHRTLRMVSQSVVSGREAVAAVSDAVYALDESGVLLRLSDSKAVAAGRGFQDFRALAFERRFDELLLFGSRPEQWFALSLGHRRLRGSFRSGDHEGLPSDCGGRLYVFGRHTVERFESEIAPEADVEWNSCRAVWPVGGAVRIAAEIYCDAAAFDCSVWVHGDCQSPSLASGVCLTRMTVKGGIGGYTWAGAMLPLPGTAPRSLSIAMKGKVSRVAGIKVESAG